MKKNLVLFLIFISLSVYLQAQTHHFSFEIKSKSEISQITKIISIDNVKANKVWAYANDEEFAKFMELNYKIEELPLHENQGKVINMATTVAQMANWDKYPTYEVYVQMMNKFATDYPTLCQVVTIGNTQSGRQLLALKISDNISQNEQEPEFFYSSTMHGDETTGMILTLRLADYLLSKYNKDQSTTDIVNNTEIYITPDANPDGTYTGGNSTVSGAQRYYTNGHDPNRDFPDPDNGAHPNYTTYSQETQAMMDFATAHHFVMGANFHGGAEVYNYPWDTWSSAANINADDSWFSKLGTDYVASARILNSSYMTDVVPSGVTEGYDWYEAIGGRQDYMNYWHHFKEVTIEVSSTKTVSSDMLPTFWNYNKDALLNFIKESLNGIRGFVLNNSRQPLNSTITVLAHDKDNTQVVTDLTGNYHRPIFTGNWNLQFESTGYSNINVNSVGVTNGTTKFVDIIFGGTLSTTTFTGTITNQKNGLPLENVNIQLTGNSTYNTTTDASGNFSIADMNEGTYKITLSKTGYMSAIHYEAITTVSNIFAKSIVPFIDVNGIVTESGTGTLLEGVSIQILNSSYSASTTNASGVYTINNVTEGNYDIKASKPGYATITTNVAISTTNNIVNFELPISVAESFETAIPSGWTFTGVNWTRVNTGAYDGTYCIKSGAIANDGNSTMLVTKDLQGGNISFFYKVSSESGYDFLKFYIDGIEKGSWSGTVAWTQASYPVSSGSHIYKWEYSKDGSTASGSDCSWVDYVEFPPATVANTYNITFKITSNEPTPAFIEGASISFNNEIKTTNALGEALFSNVTEATGKPYSITKSGFVSKSGTLNVNSSTTVNLTLDLYVSVNIDLIRQFSVSPNPFSDNVSFKFTLQQISDIELTIYNYLGETVHFVSQKQVQQGNNTINWNASKKGSNLENGVYFYKLKTNSATKSGKLILNK